MSGIRRIVRRNRWDTDITVEHLDRGSEHEEINVLLGRDGIDATVRMDRDTARRLRDALTSALEDAR